jgi:hypothetical protein
VFSEGQQKYTITHSGTLEINGISVLEIFTGFEAWFPHEVARQERLTYEGTKPQSAEDKRIAELEAELQRLKDGR